MYWAALVERYVTPSLPSRVINVISHLFANLNPLRMFYSGSPESFYQKMKAFSAHISMQGHQVHFFQLPSQAYLEQSLGATQLRKNYIITAVKEHLGLKDSVRSYNDANTCFLTADRTLPTVSDVERLFLSAEEDGDMPKYERHLSAYGNEKYAEYVFSTLVEKQAVVEQE
mgnify:CR=1 FL=1